MYVCTHVAYMYVYCEYLQWCSVCMYDVCMYVRMYATYVQSKGITLPITIDLQTRYLFLPHLTLLRYIWMQWVYSPSHFITTHTFSLTHSLTYSLTYSLTHLLSYSLTYSLTHLLTCSLTHLLTYSLTHLLTHLLTYSLTHLLTYSLTHLLTYSFT